MSNKRCKHWKTRDGRVVLITKMDDAHLCNTLRFLRRRAEPIRWGVLERMIAFEATLRGDAALTAMEDEMAGLARLGDDDMLCQYVPGFSEMLDEAERRGLAP